MADRRSGGNHGIRPAKDKKKKIHVRAECEKCGRFECISVYEDQVEHADFKVSFYECQECQKSFCDICVADQQAEGKVECPFCHKLKPDKVKPFDIYVCGVCFREWWREGGFCHECKYV
jgi:hypothetical protein